MMKTSARNELNGTIVEIKIDGVVSEVVVKVSEDVMISANITNDSKENLDLKTGEEVSLLVKSSFVILSKEKLRTTARNNIQASVTDIIKGAVNSEIKLSVGENSLCSVITNDAAADLDLKKGDTAYAMFKASSVILVAK